MTPEEDKIVLEALEVLYLAAVKIKGAAESLGRVHRAHLIEVSVPKESDDEPD